VAEVLYEKENGAGLAARRAIPLVCERQQRFLFTLRREHLVDVLLSDVAAETAVSTSAVARGIRDLSLSARSGTIAIDRLVGPVGHGWPKGQFGYIETWRLIPTDEARDRRTFEEVSEIFKEGRDTILDPVLVVEDSR